MLNDMIHRESIASDERAIQKAYALVQQIEAQHESTDAPPMAVASMAIALWMIRAAKDKQGLYEQWDVFDEQVSACVSWYEHEMGPQRHLKLVKHQG